MILQRFYPGFGFLSFFCFLLFVISLVVILFRPGQNDLNGTIAWGVFAVGMAVVGGAAWVVKTVLELGFHLHEAIREAKTKSS